LQIIVIKKQATSHPGKIIPITIKAKNINNNIIARFFFIIEIDSLKKNWLNNIVVKAKTTSKPSNPWSSLGFKSNK
jgi:hypothetical protein